MKQPPTFRQKTRHEAMNLVSSTSLLHHRIAYDFFKSQPVCPTRFFLLDTCNK